MLWPPHPPGVNPTQHPWDDLDLCHNPTGGTREEELLLFIHSSCTELESVFLEAAQVAHGV